MENLSWHKGVVIEGHKDGRTIGFPTINLDPTLLPQEQEEGVYASFVRVREKSYTGALYLGPRSVFGEEKRVLEIHLLDFNRTIYGEEISFSLVEKVRGLVELPSVEALEYQMNKDMREIREITDSLKTNRRVSVSRE